jgi:ABC-type transport system involved in cytochrome c biogenesis permease subunit
MMNILNVLLFFAFVAMVTIIQARILIRKKEVKESIIYSVIMSIVVVMYAFVTLKANEKFSPISILQVPFENVGKFLLKQ